MANSNLPFSRDPYDDLADLFLTEPTQESSPADPGGHAPLPFPLRAATGACESRPTEASAVKAPRLMAIVRVNLPVIAGPWLEQAAAAIASQAGPVVLIRERHGKLGLDLVAGRDGQQAAAAALATPAESLPAAVEQLQHVIACWVVEAPSSAAARPAEWDGFHEIVLLTGADQAATVAAYAQAKSICASASHRPAISLIVVGSEEDAARRSAGRIARACKESLGCAIELRAIVRRMQPVPMRNLGRFPQIGELGVSIAEALGRRSVWPVASPVAPVEIESPQAAPPVSLTLPRVVLRPRAAAKSSIETAGSPMPMCEPSPATPAEPVPTPPVARQPAPDVSRGTLGEAAESASSISPAIAKTTQRDESGGTLLSLLCDLQPLEVVCPRAPQVELGFDRTGCLHTLAEDDSAEALQRLLVASDWAAQHSDLLRRLNPWLALAAASGGGPARVTSHLFTSRPRERRHLADGSMRIHILIRDAAAGKVVSHLELN